jgi:hypothetical protein
LSDRSCVVSVATVRFCYECITGSRNEIQKFCCKEKRAIKGVKERKKINRRNYRKVGERGVNEEMVRKKVDKNRKDFDLDV